MIIYQEEFYNILGACFAVHNELGSGFLEAVYQECLEMEFSQRSIPFKSQLKMQIYFKNTPLQQRYIPDFLCYEKIILEIKAVKTLTDEHRAQIINDLRTTKMKLGILINFSHFPKIEYERFPNYK